MANKLLSHLKCITLLTTTFAYLSFSFMSPKVLAQELVPNSEQGDNARRTGVPEIPENIDIPAPSIPLPDFISDFIQDIRLVVGDIETFLSEAGIAVNTGEIGLPDLERAKILFDENLELDEFSDLFSTQTGSTFANREKLLQQYLKDVSQEYAENSILSESGQAKIAEKIAEVNETAQRSNTLSGNSSGQDVSQNILRNVSEQLSLQQQTDAMNIFELQEAKVANGLQLEMTSELLTEISKSTTFNQRQYAATNKIILNATPYIMMPSEREVR